METQKPIPTTAQLQDIARLYPGMSLPTLASALEPFHRDHLVSLYAAARDAHIEAIGVVRTMELARFAGADSNPGAPPLPMDTPRHEAACKARDEAKIAADAAWQKIQRIIDRANQVLRERGVYE